MDNSGCARNFPDFFPTAPPRNIFPISFALHALRHSPTAQFHVAQLRVFGQSKPRNSTCAHAQLALLAAPRLPTLDVRP
jgi:hypothetical protein